MRKLIAYLICIFGRALLSLRYKIEIKGKKEIFKGKFDKKKGTLFLPNHPALVDPIFISLLFWKRFKLRPLVVEYVYRQSGINFIMRLMKALSVPNMDFAMNEIKIKRIKAVIDEIERGIKSSENFIIYPAGRLKHTGREIVGGASAIHQILQESDPNIVLIRTTGLWGSSFSRAYTGRSPDFKKTVLRGIKNLLKSFIFFMPRRKVIIEMEGEGEDFPRHAPRLELNKYLENWYNRYPVDGKIENVEPLSLVSYSPFRKKFIELPKETKNKKVKKEVKYSSKIEEKVFSEIAKLQPDVDITHEKRLAEDLGLDSLDISELVTFLSLNFEVENIHPEDIETVADVLEIAEGKRVGKKAKEEAFLEFFWPEEKRKELFFEEGESIIELFLKKCDRMGKLASVADDTLGVLSYKKLKLSVIVLAREIKKMPGDRIGVLLPASVAAYILILAIELVGKVPVMLNWTSGPRYLNHMANVTGAKTVISSWKFIDRIANVEFGEITKKLRLLEDIKKGISFSSKLSSFLLASKRAKSLLRHFKLKIKKDDIAVILFTSGTEANPKGVPLSHGNILSNQKAAVACVKLKPSSVMYGILPPFHSFGFSVAGILPILYGLRIVFSPDPTDCYTIAKGIRRWKVTILCAAPSFLRGILRAATEEELETIELFVTGAEKMPKPLLEKVRELGKNFIEGYGITECSPMISLVREGDEHVGVGKVLPNLEMITIDPETKKPLDSPGKEGEICVRGDSIFSGYLGVEKDPFIEIDGKRWYCTGDLGYLDKGGNLILSGRLKRFAKIGGEMISLGSMEEIILDALKVRNVDLGEGAAIAICEVEKDVGKSELILFTTLSLDIGDVNMILRKAGCSRLVKINKIKRIDSIPLMGTGKVDYRFLQRMVE